MAKENAERFLVRKRYLQESLGDDALDLAPSGAPITRKSLEEDARLSSLHDSTPNDRFWSRQRGWQESLKVGTGLIDRMAQVDGKKAQ